MKNHAEKLAQVIATAAALSPAQQAVALGVSVDSVYSLRACARRRGINLPTVALPTKYFTESEKWDALGRTERCTRCFLLGPHECLPLHPDGWERRGPGRSYPEPGGCGITVEEKSRMRTVESKFVRFTNAKREAARK